MVTRKDWPSERARDARSGIAIVMMMMDSNTSFCIQPHRSHKHAPKANAPCYDCAHRG
jgi:hypothetical protein